MKRLMIVLVMLTAGQAGAQTQPDAFDLATNPLLRAQQQVSGVDQEFAARTAPLLDRFDWASRQGYCPGGDSFLANEMNSPMLDRAQTIAIYVYGMHDQRFLAAMRRFTSQMGRIGQRAFAEMSGPDRMQKCREIMLP